MNRTFWLTIVAYFAVSMSIAYPWHMVFFHEKYVAMGAFSRGEPIMPFGMAAVLIQGIVFAYFYPLFYAHKGGGHPIARGVQFSLFLGLTVWTVMVLATAAKFASEPIRDFFVLGTVFQIIQFLLVGIAVGIIYGRSGIAEHQRA